MKEVIYKEEIKKTFLYTVLIFLSLNILAQPVPNVDENIPFLVVFGEKAPTSWGDDDYSQTFFFLIPKNFNQTVYIRVFDPDIGGMHDELNGLWDTRTTFSVYGGKDCWSENDAKGTDPAGKYKSGVLLATRTFGEDARYDNNWYTFGPFNPTEGEFVERWDGNVFKIIAEGVAGDDGNLYRYFLSTDPNVNKPIEGANAFAYEYSFRMHNDPQEVSHIYPYIDDRTITVKLWNFDWDNDGFIKLVSVARKGQLAKVSNEDEWAESEFKIYEEEKNTSIDVQLIKKKNPPVLNNNVVVYVKNQYGELLEFFTSPIGGVPKYKYSIGVKPKE